MEKQNKATHIKSWANLVACATADTVQGVLTFIPNGVEHVYRLLFQKAPILGPVFSNYYVRFVILLFSGVLIWQTLATDIARFILKPIAFVVGAFIGILTLIDKTPAPEYNNQVGHFLSECSGPSVFGAMAGMVSLLIGSIWYPSFGLSFLNIKPYLIFAALGSSFGLFSKLTMMAAINSVKVNNAENEHNVAMQAASISKYLKGEAKKKSSQKVRHISSEIISQFNGEFEAAQLDEFFVCSINKLSERANKKIDRHLSFITEKAMTGCPTSLKKLKLLKHPRSTFKVEQLVNKVINQREKNQIFDKADTLFDQWQHRHLKMGNSSDINR